MKRPDELSYTVEELNQEVWKDILGFEGFYQASNLGRFRSLPRVIVRSNGITENKPGRILKNNYYSNGYVQLILYVDKVRTNFIAHRVIAEMFVANPYNKDTVNHKNGIKNDLRAHNLEWCTRSENNYHAYKIGLSKANPKKGEDSSRTKLTNLEALEIRQTYKPGKFNKTIFEKYKDKISKSGFNSIARGKSWKHLTN